MATTATAMTCPRQRAHARRREAEQAVAAPRRRPTSPPKQDPADSALLHASAADALVMAATPIRPDAAPVAVILEDGTVHALPGTASADAATRTGRVSTRSWTLWWQRRTWTEA